MIDSYWLILVDITIPVWSFRYLKSDDVAVLYKNSLVSHRLCMSCK